MRVAGKIWIENNNNEKVFGMGISELLKGVRSYGSLSEAAKRMNMSYNKAHNLVKDIERRLGYDIINSKIGGVKGGGSTLTEAGEDLIKRYDDMMIKINENLKEAYNVYFSDLEK